MAVSIEKYLEEVTGFNPQNKEELEQFRLRFLSRKGLLTDLFNEMKDLPAEQKKEAGARINTPKVAVQEMIDRHAPRSEKSESVTGDFDETRPALRMPLGTRHPLSIVRNRIIEIFSHIGFNVSEGPEIEDDWHNFSALNFPEEHPARDMQDTFFISNNPDIALRTHTSSVQVRVMESQKPPIRTISPGRVYRNEAISARAHCFFHQIEGLYIDKGVTFADMKQTLLYFSQEMFGADTQIRLRPSFFPFTEPSAEMDISCTLCKGKGCTMCKYSGWVEIMGCGMVDPAVLDNCGIDSKVYTGYALGMGIERITNLAYRVKDLRLFSENDIRFLKQFQSAL